MKKFPIASYTDSIADEDDDDDDGDVKDLLKEQQ